MAIDTSGTWWKGESTSDLQEYLCVLSEEHYQATEFRVSSCSCGSEEFNLRFDSDEGFASRKCCKCSTKFLISVTAKK